MRCGAHDDVDAALQRYEAARLRLGAAVIARARHLGAYMQAQIKTASERQMAERYRTPAAVMRETATPESMWNDESGVGYAGSDYARRRTSWQSRNSITIRSARWTCTHRNGSTLGSWGSPSASARPSSFPGLWLYNGGSYPETFGVVHIIGVDPEGSGRTQGVSGRSRSVLA